MPPAAISRSSTYFPKICGNIAFSYGSAFQALLLGLAPAATACGPLDPEVVVLEVRAHSLDVDENCAVLPNVDLDLKLQALGPFPATELGAEQVPFHTSERTLTFPDETRGVEAEGTDGNRTWFGYTDRRTERGIDVLLWADGIGCSLFENSRYPDTNAGQAMGYSPEAGVLLIAGGDSTGNAAGGSLIFESDNGQSALVDSGFPQARAYATVTPFGSKLLLAGGEDPLDPDAAIPAREARQTAVVYDPLTRSFEASVIELENERTRHAAVVMASGETLLVGGGHPRFDGSTAPVPLFEVVSPQTRRSTINGVVGLAHGRLEPVALRLDNDNLLVGGGYDPAGNPLASVEWFSPDASCPLSPADGACTSETPVALLEPRHHRAFIAMPGGGALTVGGCAPSDAQTEVCERACGTGFGCPALQTNASWIAPDGVVTPVRFAPHEACPNLVPERVLFAAGSDGSPWLLAYDNDVNPPCRAVFRFDPWGTIFSPATLELSHWPDPRGALTSLGPDAFVWLTEDDPPILAGTRTSSRGALSHYEASLLVTRDDPQVPVHLAPDRPPMADQRPVALFRPGGRLILASPDEPDEPVVGVYVTDTRYDDVSVELDFDDGPPVLLLGAFEIGGTGSCQWPDLPVLPLVATRRGGEFTTSDGVGNTTSCRGALSGPVSVGVRAGTTSVTLTSMIVRRL